MGIMDDPSIDPEKCPPELQNPVGLIEVDVGPTLRTALDVLELAAVLIDELPESARRDEMEMRAGALVEICERGLKTCHS